MSYSPTPNADYDQFRMLELRLRTASDDETAKIWSDATGECKQTNSGHSSLVKSAIFSADGLSVQMPYEYSGLFNLDSERATHTDLIRLITKIMSSKMRKVF